MRKLISRVFIMQWIDEFFLAKGFCFLKKGESALFFLTKETAKISVMTQSGRSANLPVPLSQSQCIMHNDEILICGGYENNVCYSYNIVKNQYKRICSYSKKIELNGHCVVKLVSKDKDANDTLLSFGGMKKHTLMMEYSSVWEGKKNNKKKRNYNKWVPFADNDNNPICIGKEEDNYCGLRAVISGSKHHLLFITYSPNNMNVFNLDTFQMVTSLMLPHCTNLSFHCFALAKENEMLLFCKEVGLSIKYNEASYNFELCTLQVCETMRQLKSYGYIRICNSILFFGGWNDNNKLIVKHFHRYSITNKTWTIFENILPVPLHSCAGILSDDNSAYIIGGNSEDKTTTANICVKSKWMEEAKAKEKQQRIEREERSIIERNRFEIENMDENFDIKKLKQKKEMELILGHWLRRFVTKKGWIPEFDMLISRYLMMKYFKPLKIFENQCDIVYSVKFSSDGTKIAAAYDETIRIWDIKSRKRIQVLKTRSNDIQFSPDDRWIVSCGNDSVIRIWDANLGTEIQTLEGHFGSVVTIQFSPDGKTIASGSCDATIRLWDVASGKEINKMGNFLGTINSVKFSHDGRQIVAALDTCVEIWDVSSGEKSNTLSGYFGCVLNAQFSHNDHFIVCGSTDRTVRLWNAKTGEMLKILKSHFSDVKGAAFLPDDQILVSCSLDKTVRLWDMKFGMEIQSLKGHIRGIVRMDISPDGNMIASTSIDGAVQLWGAL
ncbi:G-protein beta WD-40 repeats containing protein [Reticulomyxa filosa]|uniref:G-protein beta WD-40 repeats containing protein n=1 Tax=Reticulomyxa filosa TaxID=46433 RepID=X6P0U8_RETFI|nr:G-protein beta WD-40 repeats containing protein [Reticulomyxa filosa]|eukprot:ETO32190.1 G-protein beta WD-40 repeats containing protein [Reticulomyxa filosa]